MPFFSHHHNTPSLQTSEDEAPDEESLKEVAAMVSVYDRMANSFVEGGLDVEAIRSILSWFNGLQGDEVCAY